MTATLNHFYTRGLRVLGAAALLLGAGTAGAQVTSFHMIGSLPGTNTFSSGYGVSDDGSVVVGHSGNNYYYGSSSHAFRWTSDTGIIDLDPLAPAAGAYAISADGQIIVGSEISGSTKAVRWGGGGSSVTDQLYHGGEVFGVSRDGLTAVGYDNPSGGGRTGGPHRAVRYNDQGHTQFIDTPAPGFAAPTTSEALSANNNGSVIIGWAVFSGIQRAFTWTDAGGMAPITPGSGIANGVSGDGSIIVGDMAVAGARHAFRWTSSTGAVDLGTLPGLVRSDAYAISADGTTIVGMSSDQFANNQRAFMWRADIGMQDLNTVLASVVPAGYVLTEVRAVNSNGTVFAGGSRTTSNVVEAWVAGTGPCVPPVAVLAPASRTSHVGELVELSASFGGVGPFTYQWQKDGVDISGATTSHLSFTIASAGDAGTYICNAIGACGSSSSAPATIVVNGDCTADFNGDGDVGTDADIEAFFACIAGSCCPTCGNADFNIDGDVGTDADIESFFRVLSGGSC